MWHLELYVALREGWRRKEREEYSISEAPHPCNACESLAYDERPTRREKNDTSWIPFSPPSMAWLAMRGLRGEGNKSFLDTSLPPP